MLTILTFWNLFDDNITNKVVLIFPMEKSQLFIKIIKSYMCTCHEVFTLLGKNVVPKNQALNKQLQSFISASFSFLGISQGHLNISF